jgi:hypothetical protein
LREDGILLYRGRFYIPNFQELKILVLKEMHNVPYANHPGYQKTIATVKSQYYWPCMKKEVVDCIARCMECQNVNFKHRNPAGFLQPFPIPEWKWEVVTIDFITKFPRKPKQQNSIMVVVNKLKKVAHFIPVKLNHKVANITDIYMKEISRRHGVPKIIGSNRDPKFTSNFWKGFGTNMNFSTTYHPESNGKTGRVNQVIKDMLRMYVIR